MAELTVAQQQALALADAKRRLLQSRAAPPAPAARSRIEGDARPGVLGVAEAATAGSDPLNRLYQGITDIPIAAAQMVANALPDSLNVAMGGKTADEINQELGQREAEYQSARAPEMAPAYIERYMSGDAPLPDNVPFDWWRMGGNVAASLPLGVLGGESLGGAALAGAGMGLLTPQTGGDFSWMDKAEQAGLGAVGALGGNLTGRGIAAAIRPNIAPEVRTLMDAGVTPTPGQILGGGWNATEQKLTSIWGLGDAISGARSAVNREFNQAVYRDVLRPIGGKVPDAVGRSAIDDIHTQIGNAYDQILPNLTFRADNQLLADISSLSQYTQQMPPDIAAMFMRTMRDRVAAPLQAGTMTGREFKTLDSALGETSSRLMASPDAFQKLYGEALSEVQSFLRGALERSNQGTLVQIGGQTYDAAQRLADINRAFAQLVRLERAAGTAGASDGVFTPAQFLGAVRMSDRSSRRNAYARGNAMMQDLGEAGKSVLGGTVPDSGTAGRMATGLTGVAVGTNPALAIPGLLATLPYTNAGRRISAGLLTARPAIADPIARRTLDMLPGLLAGGAALTTPTTP